MTKLFLKNRKLMREVLLNNTAQRMRRMKSNLLQSVTKNKLFLKTDAGVKLMTALTDKESHVIFFRFTQNSGKLNELRNLFASDNVQIVPTNKIQNYYELFANTTGVEDFCTSFTGGDTFAAVTLNHDSCYELLRVWLLAERKHSDDQSLTALSVLSLKDGNDFVDLRLSSSVGATNRAVYEQFGLKKHILFEIGAHLTNVSSSLACTVNSELSQPINAIYFKN